MPQALASATRAGTPSRAPATNTFPHEGAGRRQRPSAGCTARIWPASARQRNRTSSTVGWGQGGRDPRPPCVLPLTRLTAFLINPSTHSLVFSSVHSLTHSFTRLLVHSPSFPNLRLGSGLPERKVEVRAVECACVGRAAAQGAASSPSNLSALRPPSASPNSNLVKNFYSFSKTPLF